MNFIFCLYCNWIIFIIIGSIWYSVEIILEKCNITTNFVYIDGQNFKKYYVNVAELEKHLGN